MYYVKSYRLIQCLYVLPGNSRLMGLGSLLLLLYALPHRQNKTPHVTSVISSPPPHHLFLFPFPLFFCPALFSLPFQTDAFLFILSHAPLIWLSSSPPLLPSFHDLQTTPPFSASCRTCSPSPSFHLSAPLSHFVFSSPC